ncbi:MAG: poly(A) polymerase [Sphaerochaetaceae bacterium]|nr:poly(A) polymerase [Sphaerochaetaceae bacterium]
MLIRYKNGQQGVDSVAKIYTKEEHHIDKALIDKDAVRAIRRLTTNGHEAYIVGGAVRDIMLNKIPKDFDIATDASPRQVKKLFYHARVIGKRFKIVHLVYPDKILEVTTFRSLEEAEIGKSNVFGTIEEDAKRRDFTLNSLYYQPEKEQLLDFNEALKDIKKKKICSVVPLSYSFIEDPVRMIRAIKYSVTTGFKLAFSVSIAIKRNRRNLAGVSNSRLTEEVFKILSSGYSAKIFKKLDNFGLLVYILPCFSIYTNYPQVFESLNKLDIDISKLKADETETEVKKAEMFKALTEAIIVNTPGDFTPEERFKDIFQQMKVFISPITPPNLDLERAVFLYMKENEITIPKSKQPNKITKIKVIEKKKKKPIQYNKKNKKHKTNYPAKSISTDSK